MLSEALNDGLSSSFEAIAQLVKQFVHTNDAAYRTTALRMCVSVLVVERDALHRRAAAGSSSSTAVPRTQLVATIMALSTNATVRGTLERYVIMCVCFACDNHMIF
jgi:hypothetical protein